MITKIIGTLLIGIAVMIAIRLDKPHKYSTSFVAYLAIMLSAFGSYLIYYN